MFEDIFDISADVRYVALYKRGDLTLRERPGISNTSSSESDRFEELLVNPTILKLVSQRGNIDCGGLEYILIRYGNFFQFVTQLDSGHISVAINPSANTLDIVEGIRSYIERYISSQTND